MNPVEQNEVSATFPKRRLKSPTRFLNKPPPYVVALALKGTYDDLETAQQMICNKRSPQESTNSITPTNSIKMFESVHAIKLDQISGLTISSMENNIKKDDKNIRNSDSNSDIKINEIFQHDINNEIEKTTHVALEITQDNYEQVNQPEVIFHAANNCQRLKYYKFVRKSKIYKNVKPQYNKFKCKSQKHTLNNHFEKICAKAKLNSVNSGQMQKRFSNISTVVSRTTVLKKVFAKENLLEETEMISILNYNLNGNEDGALHSHPPATKNDSFISNSSGNTLTQKASTTSSKNEDDNSVGTVKSAFKISMETNALYKTDVINVAVAVTCKNSYVINTDEMYESNKEKVMYKRSLTSSDEVLTLDVVPLTSKIVPESETNIIGKIDSKKISDATLVNRMSSIGAYSDDDTYDMARTSSDFNESNNNSTFTLKEDENRLEDNKNSEDYGLLDNDKLIDKKQNILDTVINLEYYPEVAPSTSSDITFGFDVNDVIITEHMNKSYLVNNNNKGDIFNEDKVAKANILKKQFNQRDILPTHKNVDLPNEAQIQALIEDKETLPRKYTENEVRLYPSNISEMWDRLVVALDVAFKRLEETVTDKIIRELKNSFATFGARVKQIPEFNLDLNKEDNNIIVIEAQNFNTVISTQNLKQEADECLQCNLVQNKVIDQIMMKFSTQIPRIMEPGISVKSLQKIKKPKLLRDYVEVLKPPTVEVPQAVVDKTDTVTISTITVEGGRLQRLRTLFLGPSNFVKENLFIITSVPAFFVVLLIVYGLMLLLMKPW